MEQLTHAHGQAQSSARFYTHFKAPEPELGQVSFLELRFALFFRYEALVESMKKKFAKKRERAALDEDDVNQNVVKTKTKRGFLKPALD